MTLALILLFALNSAPVTAPVMFPAQDPQSSASTPAPPQSGEGQPQTAPPSSVSTPSIQPETKPQKPKTVKRVRRKKKPVSVDCNATPASGTQSATTPSATDTTGSSQPPAQTAPKNCPPSKTIVRQGGTSEPSIQLAGDQPQSQRDAVNQMLVSTESNLKKLADRQLNANQQDMVGQIRQFMQQSKSAQASGDYERARTLAWKAQLLSEELINPK